MFIVQLAGHLGRDPETRFTASGQKVTSFSIAVNQRKGKEDVTTWVNVTVWGDRLDKIISFLKKGSGVIIIGRMNPPSKYNDKQGQQQFSLEVTAEMIEFSPFGKTDRPGEGQAQGQFSAGNHQGAPYAAHDGPSHSNYDEGQFQMNGANYGGQSYGAQTGQGIHSHAIDEDTLPF